MNKLNDVAKGIKVALMLGVATSAMPLVASANAEEEKVERIEVTGSRIARTELSQPSPVIVMDAAEIARMGTPDLGQMLSELPAIGATDTIIGNNNSNAFAGTSSADLRRLGSNRTLVLVNGKRHVAGNPGEQTVDLSTIPAALIERVEVITGGASAIYGSDAVSGVINVILKDDFDGFEFNATGTKSTEGVNERNHSLSLLVGTDFADGRGNVNFFTGYTRIGEVMSRDIRQFEGWGTIVNPDNTGENDGIPDRLRVRNVWSEMIHANGVVNPFGGLRYTFDEAGNPVQQTERQYSNSFAFGNFPNGCDYCFDTEGYENYTPGVEKINVRSGVKYDLAENITFFSDFKYVQSDIVQQFQPSFRFGNISINVQENPYLDDGLRQLLLDNGQTTVSMAKFFDELGNRSADNRRETFRYTAGFEGYFDLGGTSFDWEVYYVNGETTNERNTLNDLIPTNLAAAVDAVIDPNTGEIACRSQVPSAQPDGYTDPAAVNGGNCVPFNPFGQQSSQEARDWVSADVSRADVIQQEYYGGIISFDTGEFLELQGGAIGVAMGYEYREESSESTTDEFTRRGFLTNAATPNSYGEYDVSEFFVEVSLPLLSGVAFAHELTLDGAFRTADYSHAGDADAWKVGLMWAPIEELRIRGTFGEAVRAPNITEAFDPISPGFARVSDPCDADNISDDADRAANCAALGIPAGFQANDNVSVDTLSGGNPDLTPEESESLTAGFVWTPDFLGDFSMTVDYYDIEITDAITNVTAQNIANNCVDATGGPDVNFCSQVDRNPTTYDIELVRSGFVNAASLTTAGVETQFRYTTPVSFGGELVMNLLVNKVLELEIFEFQNRPDEINVEEGEVGDPELQARFGMDYRLDDLTVSWSSRFIDRSALYDVTPIDGGSPEDTSPAYIGSQVTHDMAVTYQLNDTVTLGFGVRNLFDKLPPGYTANPIYDLVGRRAFASVNVSM